MAHKAIFLDRDDTLVDDPGYIKHPDQLKLLPGAAEALIQFKKMGYRLVIVTNQSGIARGYLDEAQLNEIHDKLKKQLAARDAAVDGIYYCPYHPDGVVKDFSMESNLRKPDSGMLEQAADELDLDLARSWMIGDSYRDIRAGKKAGCRTILVDVPGKNRTPKPDDPAPDRKAVNLREAVNIVRMVEFHEKAQAAKAGKGEPAAPAVNFTPKPAAEPAAEKPAAAMATPAAQEYPVASAPTPAPTPAPVPQPSEKPVEPVEPAPAAHPTLHPAEEAPVKFHTTKKAAAPAPAAAPEHADKTHHLMEEILQRLASHSRTDLYDDFSVFKLLAVMAQVVALSCLVFSLVCWLSRQPDIAKVQILIGYGITLQLLVIALLMMHKRD